MEKRRIGNWFAERRLDYIDFRILTAGEIRRSDIIRTFTVSIQQASIDLRNFHWLYPDALVYNKSDKRYVARKGYVINRGMTSGAIYAIQQLFRCGHSIGWE